MRMGTQAVLLRPEKKLADHALRDKAHHLPDRSEDGDVEYMGESLAHYLMDMYASDKELCRVLEAFFASSPVVIFDRIKDRSMISSMNSALLQWADDGYRFYEHIRGGILHTKEINRDVNEMPAMVIIDGKKKCIIPYEYFAETIKKRFVGN